MTTIVPEMITAAEAEERRRRILAEIARRHDSEQDFRAAAERYAVDREGLALYDRLCELDFLLGE